MQMITAGCLTGISDSVAQKLSGYQNIDKRPSPAQDGKDEYKMVSGME
jgi:hypothetical protein